GLGSSCSLSTWHLNQRMSIVRLFVSHFKAHVQRTVPAIVAAVVKFQLDVASILFN
ncbi:hypothetical protein Tco_0886521, partial [Tanacetum coccineum]